MIASYRGFLKMPEQAIGRLGPLVLALGNGAGLYIPVDKLITTYWVQLIPCMQRRHQHEEYQRQRNAHHYDGSNHEIYYKPIRVLIKTVSFNANNKFGIMEGDYSRSVR